jgi:hypothetical protein
MNKLCKDLILKIAYFSGHSGYYNLCLTCTKFGKIAFNKFQRQRMKMLFTKEERYISFIEFSKLKRLYRCVWKKCLCGKLIDGIIISFQNYDDGPLRKNQIQIKTSHPNNIYFFDLKYCHDPNFFLHPEIIQNYRQIRKNTSKYTQLFTHINTKFLKAKKIFYPLMENFNILPV